MKGCGQDFTLIYLATSIPPNGTATIKITTFNIMILGITNEKVTLSKTTNSITTISIYLSSTAMLNTIKLTRLF